MAKIGIDFGTTQSTISRINPRTGLAEAIRIRGKEKIPTMLYFPLDGGAPVVGQEAFDIYNLCNQFDNPEEANRHLAYIFSNLKRDMNPEERLYLPNGEYISYAKMISIFFAYIKNEVEQTVFGNEEISDVCITHPVDFPEYKKSILLEAATTAGFTNVKLLMEPIAAAMGFENTTVCLNESILIYDFGGGTFDLAFIKFDQNGDYITLPPLGYSDCGGEDIDRLLYDEWDKLVYKKDGRHITNEQGMIDYPFLKVVCMQEKEFLSSYLADHNSWTLKTSISHRSYSMEMNRESWNNLISPIVDRTIALTRDMLQNIDEAHFSIDRTILIGGSSQIPLVTNKLKDILPNQPMRSPDLDIAVAKGAAIFINQEEVAEKQCFCRKCGKQLNTKIKFCTYCGTNNFRFDYRFENC